MWSPIKKTLKKINSASSSRHSWSSASSRDDMSVDSSSRTSVSQEDTTAAIPKSHIRIYRGPQRFEQEALELLKKQTFGHVKFFEPIFLMKTGLKQDMNRAFAYVGWEDFADITEPDLTTRVDALGQQQDQISQDLAHHIDLTQQNWGMTTSVHYDLSGVFTHLGLSRQWHNPYQQQYYPYQQQHYPHQQQYNTNQQS
ncbi:hypothetical protein C2845_PM18G06470 [Panicum miliaceum]|uniref:Uncharacterized protein n=1 Tax=Panicum miliaceum TaxID=4540 RepID=A0A3L6PPB9_PANMI|nr:hypothetical protein C2845_PM18G06470 [Panicum miliaceum]